MAGRQVTIEFLGNSRNLQSAIAGAENRTSRLGGTLKRIGKSAAIGFAGATIVAGKALWDMGEAAAQDEASQAQLARQLKNNTGATKEQIASVEDWITKAELATGISDDDLRSAYARLATATGDVHKSQHLLNLAMNVSAGTGKDLKTVTEALSKAQNGSLGGLSRLGVKIKDVDGHTKSLNDIQDEMAKKFRGATASAAETAAGKMARLKVQLAEAGESIGYKLLPYATKFANWMLERGIPGISKLWSWLKEKLGPAFSSIIDWFKKGTKSGDDLSGTMDDLKGFIDDVKRAWVVVGPLFKDAANNYFPAMRQEIKLIIKGLKLWADAMIWLWNNVVGPNLKFMLNAFAAVTDNIGKMLSALGHVPGFGWAKDAGKALQTTAGQARKLANNIRDIPDRKDVAVNVVTHYATTGKPTPNAPGAVGGPAPRETAKAIHVGAAALDMMNTILAAIGGKKKKLQDVLAGVRDAISSAKDNIASILEDKASWAEGFQSFVGDIFSNDFSDPETGAYTGTIDSIIAYQQSQLLKATQLQADMAALIKNGLSPALLEQLQSAGASGAAQIHTLASATPAQIANLNSLQSQTAGALSAAGAKASDVVFKDQLTVANQQLNQLQAVNTSLAAIQAGLDKNEVASIRLEGSTIVWSIRKEERQTGRKLLVSGA